MSQCGTTIKANEDKNTIETNCTTSIKCTVECKTGFVNSKNSTKTFLVIRCKREENAKSWKWPNVECIDVRGNGVRDSSTTPATKVSRSVSTLGISPTVPTTIPTVTCPEITELDSNNIQAKTCPQEGGASCILTCKDGHRTNQNGLYTQNITCNNEGEWSPLTKCTKIKCEKPTLHDSNANLSGDCLKALGTTCRIACKSGYKLITAETTITCQKDSASDVALAQWVQNPAGQVCQEITCPAPTFGTPPKDILEPIIGSCKDYSYQSSCEIRCRGGYKFVDGKTLKTINCQLNGMWSMSEKEIGSCEQIKCEDPNFAEENTIVLQSCRKAIDERCQIRCIDGYKLKQTTTPAAITCKRTSGKALAQWNPSPKYFRPCEAITCPDPQLPTAGRGMKPNKLDERCFTTINGVCEFTCPAGYKFPNNALSKRTTCRLQNEVEGYWDPTPGSISSCEPKVFEKGSCEYWFSDSKINRKSAGDGKCKEMLGQHSVLAIPKTDEIKSFINEKIVEEYGKQNARAGFVGATFNTSSILWDDGDKSEEAITRRVTTGTCVALSKNGLQTVACGSGRRYICEKPMSENVENRCSEDSCKSGGTCIPYGCGFRCECQDNFYGHRCEEGPVQIEFTITTAEKQTVIVTYRVRSNVGSTEFELRVNGRVEANRNISERGGMLSGNHEVEDVKTDLYVSGRAIIQSQPDAPITKCHKFTASSSASPVDIKKNKCDGTVLNVSWKPLTRADGSPIEYDIYVDGVREQPPNGNRSTIKGLKPNTGFKIKVVPRLVGCEELELFENHTRKTSKGPPGPSNVTVLSLNIRPYSTCNINWKNDRPNSVGGYKIEITEKNKNNAKVEDRFEFDRNSTAFVHNTKPNSFYQVRVGTKALQECSNVQITWSQPATGCYTESAPPRNISIPAAAVTSPEGNTISVQITPVDERNGQVSCYIVVIQKMNGSETNNVTVTDMNEMNQGNGTVKDGERFVAAAVARFDGDETLILGDEQVSCCDMSNSSNACDDVTSRKKRAAKKETVVRGYNRKLDPNVKYRHYVIVSTPQSGGEPFVTASPLSKTWPARTEIVDDERNTLVGVKIALPVVGVFVIVILVICFFIYKRRHVESKAASAEQTGTRNMAGVQSESAYEIPMQLVEEPNQKEGEYFEIDEEMWREHPDKIVDAALAKYTFQLENLFQKIKDNKMNENKSFSDELKVAIPRAVQKCDLSSDHAKHYKKYSKNRDENIVPYDKFRVNLEKIPEEEYSDYINASYIDGYKQTKVFIATQGPQPNTMNDFWRMIWERKCYAIAVLTKLVEGKEVKCSQYWPDDENACSTFGEIEVSLVGKQTTRGQYVARKLKVSKGDDVREITQFQFIGWSDLGYPESTASFINFHKFVMLSQPSSAGPIVVHCSTGGGRTGMFIALCILSKQIAETDRINICSLIGKLSTKRTKIIDTLDQYVYLHKLVHELFLFGETDVKSSGFSNHYNKLLRSGFDQEFAKLDNVVSVHTGHETARMKSNRQFNANPFILPYDSNLVFIQMTPTDKHQPYYNASYASSYDSSSKFIVAQTPAKDNVEMFLRVAMDNNACIIVALCEMSEIEQFCYWPKEYDEIKHGSVSVRTTTEDSDNSCVFRTLEVANKAKKMTVHHILYGFWSEEAPPAKADVVLDILKRVENHQRAMTHQEEILTLVHCSDASGRSGTYCAISNLIARLKVESRIDVLHTVKDLRDRRPLMVRNLAQYEFCYKAVYEYLQMFSPYQNFQ